MATRRYFQSAAKWTPDRDDAYDFGFISKAMQVAHRLRIRDLELVLSLDDLERAAATPFQKLLRGLAHAGKHHVAGKRASRAGALA
jgi:hypothetical protein